MGEGRQHWRGVLSKVVTTLVMWLCTGCAASIPQKPVEEFSDSELLISYSSLIRNGVPDVAVRERLDQEIQRRSLLSVIEVADIKDRHVRLQMKTNALIATLGMPYEIAVCSQYPDTEVWVFNDFRVLDVLLDGALPHAVHFAPNGREKNHKPGNFFFVKQALVDGFYVKGKGGPAFFAYMLGGHTVFVPLIWPDQCTVRVCHNKFAGDDSNLNCSDIVVQTGVPMPKRPPPATAKFQSFPIGNSMTIR